MMWLEFLLDRIGGPQVFQNVFEGKKDAWSDPAVTDMLTKVQQLVKATASSRDSRRSRRTPMPTWPSSIRGRPR